MKLVSAARSALTQAKKAAKEAGGTSLEVAGPPKQAQGWVNTNGDSTPRASVANPTRTLRLARDEAMGAAKDFTRLLKHSASAEDLAVARARSTQAVAALAKAVEEMPTKTPGDAIALRAVSNEAGNAAARMEEALRAPERLVPGAEHAVEFGNRYFDSPEDLALALVQRANSTGKASTWIFNRPLIAKPNEDVAAVMLRLEQTRGLLGDAKPFWKLQTDAARKSQAVPPPPPKTQAQVLSTLRRSPENRDLVLAAVAHLKTPGEASHFLSWAKKNLEALGYARHTDPLAVLRSNLVLIGDKHGSRLWSHEFVARELA